MQDNNRPELMRRNATTNAALLESNEMRLYKILMATNAVDDKDAKTIISEQLNKENSFFNKAFDNPSLTNSDILDILATRAASDSKTYSDPKLLERAQKVAGDKIENEDMNLDDLNTAIKSLNQDDNAFAKHKLPQKENLSLIERYTPSDRIQAGIAGSLLAAAAAVCAPTIAAGFGASVPAVLSPAVLAGSALGPLAAAGPALPFIAAIVAGVAIAAAVKIAFDEGKKDYLPEPNMPDLMQKGEEKTNNIAKQLEKLVSTHPAISTSIYREDPETLAAQMGELEYLKRNQQTIIENMTVEILADILKNTNNKGELDHNQLSNNTMSLLEKAEEINRGDSSSSIRSSISSLNDDSFASAVSDKSSASSLNSSSAQKIGPELLEAATALVQASSEHNSNTNNISASNRSTNNDISR